MERAAEKCAAWIKEFLGSFYDVSVVPSGGRFSLSSTNSGYFSNSMDGSVLRYKLSSNGEMVDLSSGSTEIIARGVQAGLGIPPRYALIVTITLSAP